MASNLPSSSLTGFRISLFNEAGFTYQVTLASIDQYFDKSNSEFGRRCREFKAACRSYKKDLLQYHRYLAYSELNKIPTGNTAYMMRNFKSFWVATSPYTYAKEFKQTITTIEAYLSRFERNNLRLVTPDALCLQWFNSMATNRGLRWDTVDSLRDTFKNEKRNYLVDHFLERAKIAIETRLARCFEEIMQSLSDEYAQIVEEVSKDTSASRVESALSYK